jgi:hypothetical protein
VNSRRGLAGGGRLVRDPQGGFDAAAATGECRPEGGQFLELLHRERQPALDFGIESRLQRQIDRDMQERAGGGDLHTRLAELRDHGFEPVEDPAQIRAPDVPAVDDAERQHAAIGKIGKAVDLLRRAHQIEMQAGDGQRQRGIAIAAQPAEIGREHDLELRQSGGDFRVGVMQRLLPNDIEVEHQTWFVDLHPFGAPVGQFAQHLDVNRQQPVEQRQRIEAGVLAFCQLEKCHRPDQNRTGPIAQRPGFLVFLDRLARGEGELLILRQFRNHVVIVGVEPFRHFQRRHAVRGLVPVIDMAATRLMGFALRTAGHRKIGRERDRAAVPAIDFRDSADHH